MGYPDHHAGAKRPIAFGVLTVSDTKGPERDESGRRIAELLGRAGHRVAGREWARDEPREIEPSARRLLDSAETEAVVTTGGTGVAPRDVTVESLRPLFSKELPGFGEVLRRLSQDEIGSGAILSRATAGIVLAAGRRKPVFLLPGAPEACALAVERIILPEIQHLVEVANPEVHRHV